MCVHAAHAVGTHAESLQNVVDPSLEDILIDAVQAAAQLQKLLAREALEEAGTFGNIADLVLDADGRFGQPLIRW